MRSAVMLAAERFEDPENARVILLSAAGLVLVAVLVAAGTFWWWRTSRVEHPALGPLEVMGSRSFTKGDYTARRRRLEAARPTGADPADASAAPVGEPVDLRAAAAGVPPHFDDLADVSVAGTGSAAPAATADLAALVAAVSSGAAMPANTDEPSPAEAPAPLHADAADVGVADVDAEPGEQAALPSDAAVEAAEEEADPTSVSAEVPRPIDPLLRLQSE